MPIAGVVTIAQLASTTTAESATIIKTSLPILPSFPKDHATETTAYLYRRENATASKKSIILAKNIERSTRWSERVPGNTWKTLTGAETSLEFGQNYGINYA
jgi:hypothetical protein